MKNNVNKKMETIVISHLTVQDLLDLVDCLYLQDNENVLVWKDGIYYEVAYIQGSEKRINFIIPDKTVKNLIEILKLFKDKNQRIKIGYYDNNTTETTSEFELIELSCMNTIFKEKDGFHIYKTLVFSNCIEDSKDQ